MEPDNIDLGNYGAGVPGGTPEPEAFQPFTQADSIRLQQLQGGLSTAQRQVDDGMLEPEEGQAIQGQIGQLIKPLVMRQQAAKAQSMQEQQQQLMQQNAHAQAIAHHDSIFRARGLQDRISTYTDPVDGQTVHLFEEAPNKWREIQFPEKSTGQAEEAPAEGGDYFPLAAGLAPAAAGEPAGGGGPGTGAATGASAPAAPSPPEPVANPDGTHTMEIWNGPQRELLTFHGKNLVSRHAFDAQGNPVTGQGGQNQQGPPLALLNEFRRRAEQSSPVPPFRGNPQNPHDAVAYNRLMGERQRHVDSLTHTMATQWLKDQAAQQSQGAIAGRQQQRQEFMTQQKEQVKAHQDRIDAETSAFEKRYDSHLSSLEKERHEALGRGEQLDTFPHLNTHEGMQDSALERTVREYKIQGRKLPPHIEEMMKAKEKPKEAGVSPDTPGQPKDKAPPADIAQHVAQQIRDIVGGGAAPSPSGQPPPDLAQPSKVATEDKVAEKHQFLTDLRKQQNFFHVFSPEGMSMRNLELVLRKAKAEKRPLTLKERAEYEKHLGGLSNAELRRQLGLGD